MKLVRMIEGVMPATVLMLWPGGAHAVDPAALDFNAVYATGYYEYAKDGSATLGLVTERLPNDRVKFVMCDNKTVEVSFKDLRASKGRCAPRRKDGGPWFVSADGLAPIYRYNADPHSDTKVLYEGQVVDLKSLKAWNALGIALPPATRASEPIGYVFKDSNGAKAMAILRDEPAK